MPNKVRPLTYKGRTLPLYKWAEEVGVSASALAHRLDMGWSVHKTLTTPAKGSDTRLRRDQTRKCKACHYGRKLARSRDDWFCDYQRIAGHKRPCRFSDCRGYPKKQN